MNIEKTQVNQSQESVESGVKRVVMIAIVVALVTVGGGWIIASQMTGEAEDIDTDIPTTGTTTDETIDENDGNNVSANEKQAGCELVGGEFNQYDECLGINESQCATLGGEWEACGSACRHDVDAELCTKQCVQFCKL